MCDEIKNFLDRFRMRPLYYVTLYYGDKPFILVLEENGFRKRRITHLGNFKNSYKEHTFYNKYLLLWERHIISVWDMPPGVQRVKNNSEIAKSLKKKHLSLVYSKEN